jgi:hypothetical protein
MIASGTNVGRGHWTVIVPAGKYVLGDPCYAVPDHLWIDLLESCGIFGLDEDGSPVGFINGHHVLGFSTAYGDGCYGGSDGYFYGVDAGLIGLVPYELAVGQEWGGQSRVVEFTVNTVCTNRGGVMQFGNIEIDTLDWDSVGEEEEA